MQAERTYTNMAARYPHEMRDLAKDVRLRLQQAHARLLIGPTFHASTSGNVPIQIHSFAIQGRDEIGQKKSYYLIAQDEDGRIVGHLTGNFRFGSTFLFSRLLPQEDVNIVNATVTTAFRGEGFAVPLVLAHRDFLQREADSLGARVRMKVVNGNAAANDVAVRLAEADPTDAYKQQRRVIKDAEQQRWRHLWGTEQYVTFDPRKDMRRRIQPADVFLSRGEGLVSTAVREVEDTRTREQKQEQFRDIMQAVAELAAAA
ncbi:MAG: hypothetical protein KGJ07_00470 [Patescibacteria group bacterium]|nr:hypothetical protein [Patescibacteria group bacterium]MDE2588399.1 hypothetical protein [Patescibacteria group bacterium]